MQALFTKVDGSDGVIGRATWAGPGVRLEADSEDVRAALARIFRPIPVVVDDPALRPTGTSGTIQLPPGTLTWFIEAARARAEPEGLKATFAPSGEGAVGWDPAGTYRPFALQIERIERLPEEANPEELPAPARPEGASPVPP